MEGRKFLLERVLRIDQGFEASVDVQLELFAEEDLFEQTDAQTFHQVQKGQNALLVVFVVDAETTSHDRSRTYTIASFEDVFAGQDLMRDERRLTFITVQLRQTRDKNYRRTVSRMLVLVARRDREKEVLGPLFGECF